METLFFVFSVGFIALAFIALLVSGAIAVFRELSFFVKELLSYISPMFFPQK